MRAGGGKEPRAMGQVERKRRDFIAQAASWYAFMIEPHYSFTCVSGFGLRIFRSTQKARGKEECPADVPSASITRQVHECH